MQNAPFADETRNIGKPKEWDEQLDGPCVSVSVFDQVDTLTGVSFMHTGWKPDPNELERLNRGGFIMLAISGRIHPVIKIYVPEDVQ